MKVSTPWLRAPVLLCAWVLSSLVASLGLAEDFDSGGVKIHYTVSGKGAPVILIHGLLASAKLNWEWPGVIAELTNSHRVIAMDCRGHGASGRPVGADQYGVKMVDDVVRLMDHLELRKADVVGYSMGGMITMKLLVLHPERVHSAVLGGMGWMSRATSAPPNLNRPRSERDSGLGDCIRGFAELAVTADEVRAVKTPLLVLIGERDRLRNLYVEPLHTLRPDIPIKVIPGAGHLGCPATPEFKDELRDFLNKPLAEPVPRRAIQAPKDPAK
jgi:pimeloyl-ACP methyl ester carboxylesterase